MINYRRHCRIQWPLISSSDSVGRAIISPNSFSTTLISRENYRDAFGIVPRSTRTTSGLRGHPSIQGRWGRGYNFPKRKWPTGRYNNNIFRNYSEKKEEKPLFEQLFTVFSSYPNFVILVKNGRFFSRMSEFICFTEYFWIP